MDGRCRDATETDAGTDTGPTLWDGGPPARVYCPDYPYTADDCGDEEVETEIRNRDSDSDGLSDLAELCEHGTNPCEEDSDGDGISDLVEVSYGSDPNDDTDNPRARGDFVFVVPYSPPEEPAIDPDPTRDALSFGTDLQKVDVFVTIDMSGSMGGEIQNLTDGFRGVVLPGLRAAIPDINVGVGRFQHCPAASANNAMHNLVDITSDFDAVDTALAAMPGTLGGSREPYRLNLWLIATGDTTAFTGYHAGSVSPVPRRCTEADAVGWPCYRADAVKIVIQAGDEPMSGSNADCAPMSGITHATAADALRNAGTGIRYIGIDSSTNATLRNEMRQMATDTGAVNELTGEPIYFRIPNDGTGLDARVVDAVQEVSRNIPIRVDAIAEDDPSDAVDAVAAFVERLETNTSGATVEGRVCTDLPTGDESGDGFPDHFPRVFPGTTVCFDIIPRANQMVPATEEPQIFRARVRVVGDMFTPLDEREVLFLVPPHGPLLL